VAKNVSDSGLFIEGVDIPQEETRFRVEFRVPPNVDADAFIPGHYRVEAAVRRRDGKGGGLGIAFREPLSERLARTARLYFYGAAAIALLCAALVAASAHLSHLHDAWIDVPVFLYGVGLMAYLVSRATFSSLYRPPKAPQADLPAVSVLVPATDKAGTIGRALAQVLASDYPADRMQVIAVNDGSRDGTLAAMESVRESHPALIVVDVPERQGPRMALAAGARMATGDILVFVEAGSFIRRNALRMLVEGFGDPRVGAVAGHCEVENSWTNLLTRLQAVRYDISGRILKAAESHFGCVTSLSGPLAACRRGLFLRVADEWTAQAPPRTEAAPGEDLSLSNVVRELGFRVLYDNRARTATLVPESCRPFIAEQLRWRRSWLRESLRAAALMWRSAPAVSLSFYLALVLALLAPLVVARALIMPGGPLLWLLAVVSVAALASAAHMFLRRSNLWIYGIPFCLLYVALAVVQIPVAAATAWAGRRG
jgi:hyaluronan synthase